MVKSVTYFSFRLSLGKDDNYTQTHEYPIRSGHLEADITRIFYPMGVGKEVIIQHQVGNGDTIFLPPYLIIPIPAPSYPLFIILYIYTIIQLYFS